MDDREGTMPDQLRPNECATETTPFRFNRRLLLGGAAGLVASRPFDFTVAHAETENSTRINAIIERMTMVEKAGQLFMIGATGNAYNPSFAATLDKIKPGGVIFLGANIGTAAQLRAFTDAIHRSSSIPPLIAIDQEGGPVTRLAGDPAPGAVILGQYADTEVRSLAKQRAQFLDAYGFDVNFAPVADVAYKPTSYMISRSFGADPNFVASKVKDVVRGSRSGNMAGAAKHFPGHGRTQTDSHLSLPEVLLSRRQWRETDALPFAAAIEAGVEMVMVGHLYYPKWEDAPTSLSRVAMRTLRRELDFTGVVVSDDLGMGALSGIKPYEVLDRAIDAGVDLLLYVNAPLPLADLVNHVRHRIKTGEISETRINTSLRRVLAMKSRRFDLAPAAGEVTER